MNRVRTGRHILTRISVILGVLSLTAALSGCTQASAGQAGADKRLSVVTTIFPEYDWVRNIAGDRADSMDITLLLNNGADLHSYQPTADDILKLSTADLFIYVGGESDAWVDDALKNAVNKDMIVIDLLDTLGSRVREEEIVEGMEAEEEQEDGEEEEEPEYDEHVWLSLNNASILCGAISDAMQKLDPEHADVYMKNSASYQEKLSALDSRYRQMVDAAPRDTILFGDRFPFRYLTEDYGLKYYAAFVGCSAETEASFETVVFLAGKTDELSLPAILVIDGSDQRIAGTIRDNTAAGDQQILVMDSLQSTTAEDIANGTTYLSAMEYDLATLSLALQ